jgi:hypothetical protein
MLSTGLVVLRGDVGRGGSRVWNICEEGDQSLLCSRAFLGMPCLLSALAWLYNGCCVARLLYSGDHALGERPRHSRELEMQERRDVAFLVSLGQQREPVGMKRGCYERKSRGSNCVNEKKFRRIRYEQRVRELQGRIRELQERNQRIRSHVQRNEKQEEDQRLEEMMIRIQRNEIVQHMEEQEQEEMTDEQRMQRYAQWMEEWRKREDYIRGRDRFIWELGFGKAIEIP